MTPDNTGQANNAIQSQTGDSDLEALREILFSRDRQQIVDLKTELEDMERRVSDKDALAAVVAPILGDAIRRKIRDSREEVVEALYPIIGELIARAVGEAIRDLARNIDAQMKTTFNFQRIGRHLKAQASGVSSAEMILRESLPFEVEEAFLIHRETGLLLRHVSRDSEISPDTDLISAMLTAIRDFSQDAFGRGEEGQLDEIQYGERRILIETAQYAYLAVVVDGVEPPGFQEEMRERVIEISLRHKKTLRQYDGDSTPLAPVEQPLRSLITNAKPRQLSAGHKWGLIGIVVFIMLCMVVACVGSGWVWQAMR